MEKLRSDIALNDKWDLSSIYENDEVWLKDYELVKSLIPDLKKYQGHLLDSASSLYEALKEYYELFCRLEKVYTYAHLSYDADTSNTTYQTYNGMVVNLANEMDMISSYFSPELLKAEYEQINKYYTIEPRLVEYKKVLEEIFLMKNHTLSNQEEKIISSFSKILDASEETYEMLTDTDFTYESIIDENGNVLPLNSSNYSIYLLNKDRNIRKQAFDNIYKTYEDHINTLSSTMYNNISGDSVISKLRHYQSSIESSLDKDNIKIDVYNNLIDSVNKNLPVLHKYYKLKKDILNLSDMHIYDIYVELVNKDSKKYPFLDGKNMVIDALSVLGNDYVEKLNKAFDERWIDIYPNKGKRSGAYSGGSYLTYPYILLNYEEELGDVFTLAHELGHSMHSYYSRTCNPYQVSDYKIFVAEVASTVNELLLAKHLIKTAKDKDVKLLVLNKLLELFKGTIFRQTMFAEFEKEIHSIVDNDGILNRENLCNIYYDLNKKYFGNDVIVDESIKYEWARIPHFYYNFYVYKYATGLSAACYIVNSILNNEENALENYLEFLKTGGKLDPLDTLKIASVDMMSKDVVESAIKMFEEVIAEFQEVYNN